MAIKGKEGQEGCHPEEIGGDARIIASKWIGKINHCETHLETQEFAAGLNAHEQKIDGHTQDKAYKDFSEDNENKVKRMGRYIRAGKGKMGKDGECKHYCYRALDKDRDIVCGEDREHEHDYADPHHGKDKTEEDSRIVIIKIHTRIKSFWRLLAFPFVVQFFVQDLFYDFIKAIQIRL